MGVEELITEMAEAVIDAENWYVYEILDGLHGSMPEVSEEFQSDLDEKQFRFENEKIWKEEIGAHVDRKEMMEIKISYWLALNNVLEPRQTTHEKEVRELLKSYENIHFVWNAKAEGDAGAAAFPFSKPTIVFYKTEKDHLEPRIRKNITEALGNYSSLYTDFVEAMENYTEFRRNELFEEENPGFIKTFFHELVHHHYQKRYKPKNLPEDRSTTTEIFAWNITIHFLDEKDTKKPSDVYKHPEIIEWGADRIEEMKNSREDLPDDRYDWLFQMQEDIFQKAYRHRENDRFPQKCLDIFVIEMLPESEQNKVYGVVKLTGNEFKTAFGDLSDFLKDLEGTVSQDSREGLEMRNIMQDLEELPLMLKNSLDGGEVFSPEKFRNRIIQDVTRKAINQRLSLEEVISLVDRHITQEAKKLLQIIEDLQKLEEKINQNPELELPGNNGKELVKVLKELEDVERKLEMVEEN